MGSFYEHTKRQSDAARQRQDAFIALLSMGKTVKQAAAELGIHPGTYQKWRQRDREFAARASMALAGRSGKDLEPWDGSALDFEAKFIPSPDGGRCEQTFYTTTIYNALESTQEGQICLILLPPGSRKTTTLENWALYKLATDPDHRILVISKSLDHARKSVGRLKALMTDPYMAPELIRRFGPFKEEGQERQGKPWSADYFTVARRRSSARDYSYTARGWTSQIYGSRADTIIVDDPQTLDNLDQTDKLMAKFRLDILSRRPGPGKGRVFIITTRLDAGDFAEAVIDADIPDVVITLPVTDSSGEPLDPVVFPKEALPEVRRQVGEEAWAAAYMMQPKLGENATFRDEDLDRCKDPRVQIGPLPEGDLRPVVVGLDPNLGSGYTNITACAYNAQRLQLLDTEEHFAFSRTEEILDLLEGFAIRYRPTDVRIEINNFQRGLARDDRLERMARQYGFRVREHTTDGRKNNQLLDSLGVATMARSFIGQEIVLPWHDDGGCALPNCQVCERGRSVQRGYTRSKVEPLLGELAAWRPMMPGKKLKQDRVMAFWFCWIHWMQNRPKEDFDPAKWQTRGWRHSYVASYRPMTGVRG